MTKEHPDSEGFTPSQVIERVEKEFGRVLAGIPVHISQHCVATKRPNPGRYRMLSKTASGGVRLFRPGDPYHADREGSKIIPRVEDILQKYQPLLKWYKKMSSHLTGFKVFSSDAALLKLKPFHSGLHDVSERHDEYLADDLWREGHPRALSPPPKEESE